MRDSKNKDASQIYHRVKNKLFFVGLFLDILILSFFFFSGLSVSLKIFASQFSSHAVVLNSIYILIFSLGIYVFHFPLNVFTGFFWEHKFKLSTQTFSNWLTDNIKKLIIGLVIALLLIEVIYIFLENFPYHWWIGAGLFWIFISFILAKLTPNFIIPLFFKYEPIDNEDLRERVFQLFKTCEVSLKDVYVINLSSKTKKANAFLCGFGKNRRVVLSDTLLTNFSVLEIEVVVAHELGHYKHKDILKLLSVNAVIIFLGFYLIHLFFQFALINFQLTGIDDISFLPMGILIFMLFGLVTTPILNWYSRVIERAADRFSLEKTKQPKDFISMISKLGEMNLAEFAPSKFTEVFFYDHPSISKRIKFAEMFNTS